MKLSIIIPVYNVELYLIECLDSVFSQDISECEVIAIDDGSTDSSGSILDKYKCRYPDLIVIHQTNKGLCGARNTGIDNAKGEYIYFLDSDDYLLSGSISLMLYKINENYSEIIGFNALINATKIFSCKKPSESSMTGVKFFEDFFLKNTFFPIVNVWLYVYRMDFIRRNNLRFLEGFYHEDIHFSNICFCLTCDIIVFDLPILCYRLQREGSISTTYRLKNIVDISYICRDLDRYYITQNFYNLYFYNQLFQSYIFTLTKAVDCEYTMYRDKYFSWKDIYVMRKGIMNEFEFKLWFLAIISNRFMINYYRNLLSNKKRRIINIFLNIIYIFTMKRNVEVKNVRSS